MMANQLFLDSQAFGLNDAFQIFQGSIEPVIEDNIIVVPHMADLASGRSQTLTDHFEAVLSPVS